MSLTVLSPVGNGSAAVRVEAVGLQHDGPVPDRLLVRAAASGDQRAWDALVKRHVSRLWAVARSFRLGEADSADVVQTAWLRLAENLDRLQDADAVGAWLVTTARRECLRLLRSHARVSASSEIEFEDPAPAPDRVVVDADLNARLLAALKRLPARDQQLLRVLAASPPPSYAEVSAALDMPVGSIGPTRARALARLRKELAAEGVTDAAR